MIPATRTRVEQHTSAEHNLRIRRQTKQTVTRYIAKDPNEIGRRLRELEHEWDIERVLEVNAASITLMGLFAGALWDRRAFLIPTVVAGFLLQHAFQGWCPPIPLFRRIGIRTAREIQIERMALKVVRGDLKELSQVDISNAGRLMAAVGR